MTVSEIRQTWRISITYELRSRSEYRTPADLFSHQAIRKFLVTLHVQEFRLHPDLVAPELPEWTMLPTEVCKNEAGQVRHVC
jgi:hypothetical protein